MTSVNGKDIIKRIDDVCKAKGITRKEVAKISGITSSSMSMWNVRGSIPSADVALRIAEALGTTVEYLVTGKEAEQRNGIDRTAAIAAVTKAATDALNAL